MKKAIFLLGIIFMLVVSGFTTANPLNDILDVMGFGQDAMTGMPVAVEAGKENGKKLTLEYLEKRISFLENKVAQLENDLIDCGCRNKKVEKKIPIDMELPKKVESNNDPCIKKCEEEDISCMKEKEKNECKEFYTKWDECIQEYKPQANNEKELLEKCKEQRTELGLCLNKYCGPKLEECKMSCRDVPKVTETCEDEYNVCKEDCGKFLGIFSRAPSNACINRCKLKLQECECRDSCSDYDTVEKQQECYKYCISDLQETTEQSSENNLPTLNTERIRDRVQNIPQRIIDSEIEEEEEDVENLQECEKKCELYNDECQLDCSENPEFGFCDETYKICQDECRGDEKCLRDCTTDWNICKEKRSNCILDCRDETARCLKNCRN